MPDPSSRRAVLIFAAALPFDLSRRRWPRSFSRLLDLPRFQRDSVGAEVHLFTTSMLCRPCRERGYFVHRQRGGDFRESLTRAVEKLAGLGYEEIVIVGRDCPSLTEADVRRSFQLLREKRCVLGPDHRGGLYLIALRTEDRTALGRIVWQRNSDFRQMMSMMGRADSAVLQIKRDLDSIEDLERLAAESGPLAEIVRNLLNRLASRLFRRLRPALSRGRSFERLLWQLPPPCISI